MSGSVFAGVEGIADAVMYEGYILYPYRASAMKNRFRWQFGVVAPRDADGAAAEACHSQTECVIEPAGRPRLTVRLRCLQLQRRTVERPSGRDGWTPCDRAVVDGLELLTWDEALPQDIMASDLSLDELCGREHVRHIEVPAAVERELIHDASGVLVARMSRERWAISLSLVIHAERAGAFVKVRVRLANSTRLPERGAVARDITLQRSLLGCHTMLHVAEGLFVSLTDPPPAAEGVVSSCVNEHTWPVLVGPPGSRSLMLSAPIILPDYQRVAPESSGNFFDATEIDEMLALRVMTMTDGERREAAATDARAGQIVERAGSLPAGDLARLHGAIRSFEEMLNPSDAPPPEEAVVDVAMTTVRRGARVRLVPRKRADSMDMFLAGRAATVAAIHRDLEDRIYIAVTVDDDPGADLHHAYGRFFYFAPEEIVPLAPESGTDGER